MPKQRVQVRDLEAPERIQPAPVQSDTYARPAAPPIDNSLEQLQQGLAVFGSAMTSLGAKGKAEEEKRVRTEQLAAYEAWKGSVSSDEHLNAIRSGKLPINVDRILDSVVKKDGAEREAAALAAEIDAELPRAGLGSTGFDADAFVRSKAQPYVGRLARDPRTMAYFGDNLDRIRAGVTKRHQDVLGQLQTQYLEDRGKQEIGRAILSGVERQLTPQQIMDQLRDPDPNRGIYAAVGPRLKKGSLDLSYGRMDELTLEAAEEMADKPETARYAVLLLEAQRRGIDGATEIGPLSAVARHGDKIAAIRKKAQKTMGDFAETQFKTAVLEANVADFDKGSLGFSAIRDIRQTNPGDTSRTLTYSAAQQREEAISTWLDRRQARNGGVPDTDAEVAHFIDMGIKHPRLEKVFDEAYKGFLSSNLTKDDKDRLPQIVQLGDEYIKIAERNWSYTKSLVSDDAREFFETYRVLRQLAGRSPELAAQETAMAFATSASAKDPMVVAGNLRKINEAIDRLDTNGWWPGGQVINSHTVDSHLRPLAKALSRVEGLKTEDIIQKSAKLLQERSAYVNGRMVVSPTLSKDDGQYVQPILDRIFKDHGAALREKWDIPSAKHLSIHPVGPHEFVVTKWDGGAVTVPVYDEFPSDATDVPLKARLGEDKSERRPIGTTPLRLSTDDIVRLRLAGKAYQAAKGVQAAEEWRKSLMPPLDPSASPDGKTELDKRREQLKRVRRGERP